MEEYIRKAFKSLEDFKVEIEPAINPLKEDIDEADNIDELDVRGLFEKEASYIITHDFEYAGHNYSLFLEALCEGESCDIEFEEFDINNIDSVLVEVLDSEHDFIGSLTGEDITLDTSMKDVLSKSHQLISGEEELAAEDHTAEDHTEEENERVFINGDPEEESQEEKPEEVVEIVPEEPVKEEVLNESETFNLKDAEEVDEAKKVLDSKDSEAIEQIVDASAESKEDLKKSYVGSIILQCPTCKAMMYKDPDQLVKVEGEEELYNIDEECPHCGAKDGFEVVGQVASLEVDPEAEPVPPMKEEEPAPEEEEVKEDEVVEIEPPVEEDLDKPEEGEGNPEDEEGKPSEEDEKKEDDEVEDKEEKDEDDKKDGEQPLNEDGCEIKLTTEEKNMLDKLTHGNKMDCWFWIDDETDTIKDLEDDNKVLDTCDAILTVADGTEDIENFLEPEEIELFNALVERCKACKESKKEEPKNEGCESCEDKEEKKEEPKSEEDIKLESFDEDKFDRLVTRYLKETYSNVKSYKTAKAGLNDSANKVVMEGLITFKSGKEKPTKFVFEAKEITAKKQLKLVGVNEMFAPGKAFTLLGSVADKKLLSESLAYRYESCGKKIRGRAESFRKR